MRWASWLLGVLLIGFGVAVLVWGGIPLGTEERSMEVGPVSASVERERWAEVPAWAGVMAVLAGAGVVVFGVARE